MRNRFPEGAWGAGLVVAASLLAVPLHAGSWPTGFSEVVVWSGLNQPTAVVFAADGRAFVAEKSGLVKVFDGLGDPTPTTYADLRPQVFDYWDRGLLGMTLHPDFPDTPWLYVFYTLDRKPGGPIPSWNDSCPGPPNGPDPTTDGCTAGGRLSRLETFSGTPPPGCATVGAGVCERVLIGAYTGVGARASQQWCQQFPSHSVGALAFGADGALYATAGDGGSFNDVDYGQYGGTIPSGCTLATCFTPRNVCGDPPGGIGGVMTPPTARGGALRSQSPERPPGEPRTLNGSLLRLDPDGNALPDNPMANSPDPNERRVVAYGLRNPFRMTIRPGTSEVWIGDTGWNSWEEIDWHPSPASSVVNFGWPCYEGAYQGSPPAGVNLVQPGYNAANLTICETLYGGNGTTPPSPPFFSYAHGQSVVPGDGCGVGGSSMGGLAFYTSSGYPPAYDQALFFTDYNRRCIWVMKDGADGDALPEPETRELFGNMNGGQPGVTGGAVDLEIGPAGDLFVVNYDAGQILRVVFTGGAAAR